MALLQPADGLPLRSSHDSDPPRPHAGRRSSRRDVRAPGPDPPGEPRRRGRPDRAVHRRRRRRHAGKDRAPPPGRAPASAAATRRATRQRRLPPGRCTTASRLRRAATAPTTTATATVDGVTATASAPPADASAVGAAERRRAPQSSAPAPQVAQPAAPGGPGRLGAPRGDLRRQLAARWRVSRRRRSGPRGSPCSAGRRPWRSRTARGSPPPSGWCSRPLPPSTCACSRFRPDSELEAVNRAAGARSRRSARCSRHAIDAALMAAEVSRGALDPTVGAALIALGYDRDLDAVRSGPVPTVRAARVPGWQTVELDRERGTVRIPAGARLDLGATAKALAADRAAEAALQATGLRGARLLLRRSGAGRRATAGGLADPGHRRSPRAHRRQPGQTIVLRDGGLATSSRCGRRWMTAAGPQHHLLDPRTGQPAPTPVAHRLGSRRQLPGGEHRQHRPDDRRRRGPAAARRGGPAGPPGHRGAERRSTATAGRRTARSYRSGRRGDEPRGLGWQRIVVPGAGDRRRVAAAA